MRLALLLVVRTGTAIVVATAAVQFWNLAVRGETPSLGPSIALPPTPTAVAAIVPRPKAGRGASDRPRHAEPAAGTGRVGRSDAERHSAACSRRPSCDEGHAAPRPARHGAREGRVAAVGSPGRPGAGADRGAGTARGSRDRVAAAATTSASRPTTRPSRRTIRRRTTTAGRSAVFRHSSGTDV